MKNIRFPGPACARLIKPAGLFFLAFLLLSSCNRQPRPYGDLAPLVDRFNEATEDGLFFRDPDSALRITDPIIRNSDRIDDPEVVFEALIQAGRAYAALGDAAAVTASYQQARALALSSDNDTLVARSLNSLGDDFVGRMRYDSAVQSFREALAMNEELKLVAQQAHSLAHLGLCFDEKQQPDSAIYYYLQAHDLYLQTGDPLNAAVVLGNVGGIRKRMNDLGKALENYKEAMVIFDSMGSVEDMARVYNSLGLLYLRLEMGDTALPCFEKAITISGKHQLFMSGLQGLFNKGKCLIQLDRYGETIPVLDSVYALCVENDILQGQLFYFLERGALALKLHDDALATTLLEQGLAIARATGQTDAELEALKMLVDLGLNSTGDPQLEKYHRQYRALSDSLHNEQTRVKVAAIVDDHQDRQWELENLLLKEELQAGKYQKVALLVAVLLVVVMLAAVLMLSRRRRQLLEAKRHELVYVTLQKAQNNELLIKTIADLKQNRMRIKTKTDQKRLDQLITDLENNTRTEPLTEFYKIFRELHPSFNARLSKAHPTLGPRELQLCALLRLNLSTKEIAALTYRSPSTIDSTRYQIRKKMNLDTNENLIAEVMRY